jgi:UPF0755 protein
MRTFSTLWNRISRPSLTLTLSASIFAISLGLSVSVYILNRPTGVKSKSVRIEPGASVVAIASRLRRERVIRSPRFLRVLTVLSGASRNLTAGDHPFTGGMTAWDVLQELQIPRDVTRSVTIPEGLRKERVIEILTRDLELDADRLSELVIDPAFCRKMNVAAGSLEGYLFPETYRVSIAVRETHVLEVLLGQFHRVFDKDLRRAAERIGLSVHEAVTMASIIEGEAQVASERTSISAVYHNRLKKGMRLQADPTVQYALPDGPRRLFNKDYDYDSPYNTYRHRGLPPGPILNPGAASLSAAVNPADVEYLYFVAKGDGSHVFTKTAAEHAEAKRKTQAARRHSWKRR